jgi:cytochrome c oxidase cbb3-type subunit 1
MATEPSAELRADPSEGLSASDREDYTRYTLWFIYLCIVYSIIGFLWGALMGGIKPFRDFVEYSAFGKFIVLAHAHINLLGWVEMAIFGALYYVVPRLSGRAIYSVRLVKVHFWIHNFGLVGMVAFFALAGLIGGIPSQDDPDAPARIVSHLLAFAGMFGTLVLLANCIWGYNLFRTAAGWKTRQR